MNLFPARFQPAVKAADVVPKDRWPTLTDDPERRARERPEVEIVFSPHPAVFPYFDSPDCPYPRALLEDWLARWSALANTAVLRHADYVPVLAASGVVLSDGLSMLVEPLVLNKPSIFIERPGHRPFNEIGRRVVTVSRTVATVEQARAAVDRLRTAGDPLSPRQRDLATELFGATDPPAAARVLTVLRQRIADPAAR